MKKLVLDFVQAGLAVLAASAIFHALVWSDGDGRPLVADVDFVAAPAQAPTADATPARRSASGAQAASHA